MFVGYDKRDASARSSGAASSSWGDDRFGVLGVKVRLASSGIAEALGKATLALDTGPHHIKR